MPRDCAPVAIAACKETRSHRRWAAHRGSTTVIEGHFLPIWSVGARATTANTSAMLNCALLLLSLTPQLPALDYQAPSLTKSAAPAQPQGLRAGPSCTQLGAALCVPLDSTFEPVPFGTLGPCFANDDDSALMAFNGWSFDFYGTAWSDLYVNNNGNVSFGLPFFNFSASGFPISGFPMIAPFWGDVDTRNASSGVVWFREWSIANGDSVNRLVITWDQVGYYSQQVDKRNTFQVILTDGNDPLIGTGNNVCFCYDDMQWTTGAASMGSNGFGGIPATVGANRGDGSEFFQVGRFDQAGNAYDGPDGSNDGIDYLDDQTICFSIGSGGTNVPPVFVSSLPNHSVVAGMPLTFSISAIGPEIGETVTVVADPMGLANFGSVSTPGNPGVSDVTFTPDGTQYGTHVVVFDATDDGSPTAQSSFSVSIEVVPAGSIGSDLCNPNEANSTGRPARLWLTGSDVAMTNDVMLYVADAPPSVFGLVVVSQEMIVVVNPGGSMGSLCIASFTMGRYNASSMMTSPTGQSSQALDLTVIPVQPGGTAMALAGETWNWQFWYRDVIGGLNTSNWSNAVSVPFQ